METTGKALYNFHRLLLHVPRAFEKHMGLKAGQRVKWLALADGGVKLEAIQTEAQPGAEHERAQG